MQNLAELHVHLDGSLRMQTLWELTCALDERYRAFSSFHLMQAALLQTQHESLPDYLKTFDWTLAVMQTLQAIERIAFELVEDVAAEGIGVLEVRGCPTLCQHEGLALEAIMEAILQGLKRGSEKTAVRVGWIMCALRHRSPDESKRLAQLAAAYRNVGVVGFDLAGPEEGHLPKVHHEALRIARDVGLGITLHAGEAAGPESIWDAIDQGAQRLGHACSLVHDARLIDVVGERGIALECCPSSNVQTRAVPSLRQHPLKYFLEKGLKATLNTDNRLISQTTLSREYDIAEHAMGLSHQQMQQVRQNSLEASFIR